MNLPAERDISQLKWKIMCLIYFYLAFIICLKNKKVWIKQRKKTKMGKKWVNINLKNCISFSFSLEVSEKSASKEWTKRICIAISASVVSRCSWPVIIVFILSSSVSAVWLVGRLRSIESSLRVSLLRLFLSPRVHVFLSLHLLVKLVYLLNQVLVYLFYLFGWYDWSDTLGWGFLFLENLVYPLSGPINFLRVHILASLWNYFIKKVCQFLKFGINLCMALFQLVNWGWPLLKFMSHILLSFSEFSSFDAIIHLNYRAEPVLLSVNKGFNFISLSFRHILWIGWNNIINGVLGFVDKWLILIFLVIELFNLQILNCHFLLHLFHLRKLHLRVLFKVVDFAYFDNCFIGHWVYGI